MAMSLVLVPNFTNSLAIESARAADTRKLINLCLATFVDRVRLLAWPTTRIVPPVFLCWAATWRRILR